MQRSHDDLKRRLARKFGVRVNRNAPTIVANRQPVAHTQAHFDPRRVARDRFIHAVV